MTTAQPGPRRARRRAAPRPRARTRARVPARARPPSLLRRIDVVSARRVSGRGAQLFFLPQAPEAPQVADHVAHAPLHEEALLEGLAVLHRRAVRGLVAL